MTILPERRDAHAAPFAGAFCGYPAPDGSGAAGAVRRGVPVRRSHGGQRHPLYAHMASGGGPVCGAAAGRGAVSGDLPDRPERPVQILEMDLSRRSDIYPPAGHAAGYRGQHRQPGVAGFPVPAGEGAARRDREADVNAGAGQAVGLAQGEPRPEQHPVHPVSGGASGRHLCPVLQGVLRHGQRAGVPVYLCLYVLCGGRSPAVVPVGRNGRRTGLLGAVGSEQDPILYEAPVSGAVRPQPRPTGYRLAADPQSYGAGQRQAHGAGAVPRYPDPERVQLRSAQPAHRLYLYRYRRGAGAAGLRPDAGAADGHRRPLRLGGAPR